MSPIYLLSDDEEGESVDGLEYEGDFDNEEIKSPSSRSLASTESFANLEKFTELLNHGDGVDFRTYRY